jgi:hypothetical protein
VRDARTEDIMDEEAGEPQRRRSSDSLFHQRWQRRYVGYQGTPSPPFLTLPPT